MPWERRENKLADHFEFFRDEHGLFKGFVIRFSASDETYAWTQHKKIGKASGIGEAKDMVEETL